MYSRAFFILSLTFAYYSFVFAKPLSHLPVVETGELRIRLEMQTDLWTTLYENKETPQRMYQTQIKVPLWRNKDLVASLATENEGRSIGRPDLLVGDNQVAIGGDLRSQSLGIGLEKQSNNGHQWTVFAAYESSSDEPFQQQRDISTTFTAIYQHKLNYLHHLVLGLNKSNNRGIWNAKWLPLIGLLARPDPHFQLMLGFPFFRLDWKGVRQNKLSITVLPVGLDGEYHHPLGVRWNYFSRFGVSNCSYSHRMRKENDVRLLLEEKYIDTDFYLNLSEKVTYGLHMGYGFDRRIFEARDAFFPKGKVNTLASDVYGGFNLEYRFK